ncbi:sensor histidine kinase [Clostridium sp. WILCCON 0269]|uniref:histidine kinase n=1 Tax=Candidatus Clostridium eludens TaxID=3381663 RepID=A0ABW8SIZ8_9CLOT
MRIKKILVSTIKLAVAIFLAVSYLGLAFFITQYIYNTIGKHPSEIFQQILTSMVGLLLMILTSFIINYFGSISDRYMSEIFQVIKKISTGDFKAKITNKYGDNKSLNELVENINNMTSNLDNVEKMRQQFISNVSHEIQSPLTSIRGFAQVLRSDKLNHEDRLHYLSIIESESIRLSKLSDNLLKLTSLESENVNINCKFYRLDKQLKNLILSCEPQWSKKDIDIEVCTEEATIKADEDLLSEVWINLINNSIKFTPEGGSIKIQLCNLQHSIEFSLSDTGIGISKEDIIHVFERFYKADKSRNRTKEGSGLGLSIVKKIIDMHKGTIEVSSKLGKGTTFMVSLPREVIMENPTTIS